MEWTQNQLEIATQYKGKIAEYPEKKYKCPTCHHIVGESPCPCCGEVVNLKPMCPLDHCHCGHEVVSGIEYCPCCGEAVCPACGSHDVSQISRITGYLGDVKGFNKAKQQELLDRHRIDIAVPEEDENLKPVESATVGMTHA